MDAASRLVPLTSREAIASVSDPARTVARSSSVATSVTAEQALVRAVQSGDRDAFATLLEEHQRAVFGYVRARTLDRGHAEDITQEVFLRCYLQRERLPRGVNLRAWLIGIARNVMREFVRKNLRSREQAWSDLCLMLEANEAPSPRNDDHDDVVARLPTCLESLGKSAREALELQFQSQLRLQEIGQRLKRSEGAVKLLLFRARQALRNCLDSDSRDADRQPGFSDGGCDS
ncbi:MAG: sigma-70 family RNA polymerase sigma factor [Planctomycetes bacterium]|nr:sigma-70 family RNA polymerase sigma factor [Planctomycetota bacterium]